MAVVTNDVHPFIGHQSYGLPVRILQFIFAALVLGLSAYTVSVITEWKEVRFTVAAVSPPTFPEMKQTLMTRALGEFSLSSGC
jgi:hypothetical protein